MGLWHGWRNEIPPQAIMDVYDMPPELGGSRANFPIVTNLLTAGLFHEVETDWATTIARRENSMPSEGYNGWFGAYQGDVWSIQLTARPGYYVTPEQLYNMGLADDPDDRANNWEAFGGNG